MTVIAQHSGYRQDDRLGSRTVRLKRGPHVRMLDAAGESRRECLRIDDPASDIAAPVRNVAGREAVDACHTFGGVELGGVLQVADPAFVQFLRNRAFMPDVCVPAALVERGEYALYLGWRVTRDG